MYFFERSNEVVCKKQKRRVFKRIYKGKFINKVLHDKSHYKVKIERAIENKNAMDWCWQHFAMFCNISWEYTEYDYDILIGIHDNADFIYNQSFWENIKYKNVEIILSNNINILDRRGNIDVFSTAFYFINCLWEQRIEKQVDLFGRSEFEFSIWKTQGHEVPLNHVNNIFLNKANELGIRIKNKKPMIFLSHDIDVVYGAIKEDGFYALKNLKISDLFKIFIQHIIGRTTWLNFYEISRMEQKYGFTSTFFWLSEKGKTKNIGMNADYNIRSPRFKKIIQTLQKRGFYNGLHKSLKNNSLNEEIEKIGFVTTLNRNHCLKFSWNTLIKELNQSNINIDFSLGYTQTYGFRNGYTYPFYPYDLEKDNVSNFIEVPLTIMDGTFSRYLKWDTDKTKEKIISFIEEIETGGLISILWHNSHFTNYKYHGFRYVYEEILKFLLKNKYEVINPDEIKQKFKYNNSSVNFIKSANISEI